jgi:hypothetical protein
MSQGISEDWIGTPLRNEIVRLWAFHDLVMLF